MELPDFYCTLPGLLRAAPAEVALKLAGGPSCSYNRPAANNARRNDTDA